MKTYLTTSAAALLAGLTAFAAHSMEEPALDIAPRAVDMPVPYVTLKNPAWSRSAVVYEINTRQFTKEGTFAAAQKELPRLKKLGVDILWLMPVHPIGIRGRLGPLGSPYSVRDYLALNPELGTMADLRHFVDEAHRHDMHVILDWVANHSARDNPLTVEHPDWYERDWKGDFRPATWQDWSDIIDFDYTKPALRRYMTEALKFWVKEADIDGFRADFAGGVPLQFWENARAELDSIKPVFMLAEWDDPELHRRAFDATYAWKLVQAMKDIAAGKADTRALTGYFAVQDNAWPREGYRLAYTSNHDVNAWEGTDRDIFGPALTAMVAFTFAADTMPMIYNGLEAGNTRRLDFLKRDPIIWHDDSGSKLYAHLIAWKKANPALHNGRYGGRMIALDNDAPGKVFSFMRRKDANTVVAVFNFSREARTVTLASAAARGRYSDFDGKQTVNVGEKTALTLPAWGYRLLSSDSKAL